MRQTTDQFSREIDSLLKSAKRMARRYGTIGLVEPDDLAQQAMIRVLIRAGDELPGEGWIYNAVRYEAMDAGRIAARDSRACSPYMTSEPIDDYCVLPVDNDLMESVQAMVATLTESLRQVLILFSEGYSYLEIAEMTNVKIGTVRSRLYYARHRARQLLKDLV